MVGELVVESDANLEVFIN